MRLIEATPDSVVSNCRNHAFYRFDRAEDRGRARIRPLELFPSGLLIPKPTPTTVSGDLEVDLIGAWSDDMVVQGTPSRTQEQYRTELDAEIARLVELQEAYELLPPGGVGKQSRGSWANKIKNCQSRIEVLRRGLDYVPEATEQAHAAATEIVASYKRQQLVQLPSGRPAKVVSLSSLRGRSGEQRLVRVMTVYRGVKHEIAVPPGMLRDWSQARLCSV